VTKPYYQDDRVTLYRADALAVLQALPDASVDALITDPPYSSGGMVRGDRTQDVHTKYVQTDSVSGHALEAFSGDTRDSFGYWFWCSVWLGESMRVLKPGAIAALFTGIQSGGYVWRGIVPWHRPNGRPVQGRWANSCEYVVWGTNGIRALDIIGPHAFPGFFQATTPRTEDREHITQKPLDVMRQLVKIVPEGGTVLDLFMGAGTTGVAVALEGRKFIGSELTPHYATIAERRIRTAQGQVIPRGDQDALDFGEVVA
jgi:site-specific DNA-methyltransferase (adenine-specific)